MEDVLQAEALAPHAAHAHAHAHGAPAAMHMGTHRHGSWGGHVLPGAMFLVWGIYWCLAASASWHSSARAASGGGSRGVAFRARPWWPLASRSAALAALEPLLKTLLPLLGVFVELYFHPRDVYFRAALDAGGERFNPDNLNNWQHAAMYAAFAFSGACDLLLAQPLARIIGFASLAQAFAVELLLFWFHLRMQAGLVADVHVLLCFAVAGCSVATVAEGALHGSGAFAPTVARVFFTLLQGTWFCQAAHILYGPKPWDPADDANSMMLPVVFTAHVLAVGAAMLAMFTAVGKQPWAIALLSSGGATRGDAAMLPVLLGLVSPSGAQKRASGDYEHVTLKTRGALSEEDA